jgi:hypothetical protein
MGKVFRIERGTVRFGGTDPSNPDVLYAAAQQRRRHVWTQINGGPESALYKTTDAGATGKKLEGGVPGRHVAGAGLHHQGLALGPTHVGERATRDDSDDARGCDRRGATPGTGSIRWYT